MLREKCSGRIVATAGALLFGVLGIGAAAPVVKNVWWDGYTQHAQRVTLADGRAMNLYCEGRGAPVVVLDSGLGDGAWSWRKVHSAIAAVTRTCAYDRAGYGGSDPGPMPRDTAAIASDLEALLTAAKLPGPYVLVGHSLGSYNLRLFAYSHPAQVAGMMLVDPSGDRQVEQFEAIAPGLAQLQIKNMQRWRDCAALLEKGAPAVGSADYKTCVGAPPEDMPEADVAAYNSKSLSPNGLRAMVAEFDSFRNDGPELIAARRQLGDIPLRILSGGKTMANFSGFSDSEKIAIAAVWRGIHDDLATLSRNGRVVPVPDSGHYIQNEQPAVVIDAVRAVVQEVRKR